MGPVCRLDDWLVSFWRSSWRTLTPDRSMSVVCPGRFNAVGQVSVRGGAEGWRGACPHPFSYVCATWQWAVTAAVDFSLAQWIGTTILLSTGTALNGGYSPPRIVIIAIYAFILFVHGLLNTCPVTLLAQLETISVWWHIGGELLSLPHCWSSTGRVVIGGWMLPSLPGTFLLIFLLPFVSPTTQTASYVFATYTEDPSTGITSSPYLFLLGLLFAQYSLSGFDASAHMVTHHPPPTIACGEWGEGPDASVWRVFRRVRRRRQSRRTTRAHGAL